MQDGPGAAGERNPFAGGAVIEGGRRAFLRLAEFDHPQVTGQPGGGCSSRGVPFERSTFKEAFNVPLVLITRTSPGSKVRQAAEAAVDRL